MAEGARLESVYTATYRRFESPPHRHIPEKGPYTVRAFFLSAPCLGGMRIPDRGSTTGAASGTDWARSEQAARRASEASQSPPHRHIPEKGPYTVRAFFLSAPCLGGMRIPDRGSTTCSLTPALSAFKTITNIDAAQNHRQQKVCCN